MALIAANELKRKLLIAVDGQPYVVLEVFFASPTARGAAAPARPVRTSVRLIVMSSPVVVERWLRDVHDLGAARQRPAAGARH